MFDTMTLTKATGALCGMFLVYLLGAWAAESIYHQKAGGHGDDHGDGHAQQAYVIEVEEAGGSDEAEETGPSFEELYAAADAGKGERVWGKCSACHKLEDGANGTGPHLYALVGREIAGVEGYAYSGALAELAGNPWTPEELDAWLENPGAYAKGTKMNLKLPKATDRANLIAYLATIGG